MLQIFPSPPCGSPSTSPNKRSACSISFCTVRVRCDLNANLLSLSSSPSCIVAAVPLQFCRAGSAPNNRSRSLLAECHSFFSWAWATWQIMHRWLKEVSGATPAKVHKSWFHFLLALHNRGVLISYCCSTFILYTLTDIIIIKRGRMLKEMRLDRLTAYCMQ